MKKMISILCLSLMAAVAVSAQERFVSETAQNRKALLEEYTGIHCGYCPDGHRIAAGLAEQYPDDLFLINIHAGGYASPSSGEVDLRTSYGDNLVSNAGVDGFPSGSVNRHVFSGKVTALNRGAWAGNIPKILAMPSYVNIAAKGTLDWETRQLTVTVQLYYTESATVNSNFLHVAITQDNIVGTQSGASSNPAQVLPGGKYVHHHALRDLMTGQWGEEITTVNKGDFVEKTYTATLPDSIRNVGLELVDLQVLAFVTETRNEVMNACEAMIEHKGGPDYFVGLSGLTQKDDEVCDQSVSMSVRFANNIAVKPLSSLTFHYEVLESTSEGEIEYTPETPMTAGQKYILDLPAIMLPKSNKEQVVRIKLLKVNDVDYDGDEVEATVLKRLATSPTEDIAVNIWQDKYGMDITWDIISLADGDTLISGGPYPDLSGTQVTKLQTTNVKLADGCYAFYIYDFNKDGINTSYGAGHIAFNDANGNAFYEHDGKYKASLRVLLHHDPNFVSNRKETEIIEAVLLPNPASEYSLLKVDMPSAKDVRVRLMAVNGSCVLDMGKIRLDAGLQEIMLPVKTLNEGLYFVTVQGDGFNLTRKLVILR